MASPASPRRRSDSALAAGLAERLAAAVLPGDIAFPEEVLTAAARFVLATGRQRNPGEPAIALESVPGPVGQRLTRIAVINDDMPFLVDSITGAVTAQGLAIDRLVHPVVFARRDGEGRLTALAATPGGGDVRESIVYLETSRADARTRQRLAAALEATLADVRAAVTDWPAMRAAMEADAETLTDPEGAALLRWLSRGMLTQLGHLTRRRDGGETAVLGVCRASASALLAPASYERAFEWFARDDARPLLIVKSNQVSTVHRRVPFDLFIVPLIERRRVAALSIHVGVWTSAGLGTPPTEVPRLRAELAALMNKFGFNPTGHSGKALVHALTTLPHDLLIGFSNTDLERVATTMMSLVDRPRPRMLLVRGPLRRHLFAFVWLPRDGLSTAIRLEIHRMLEGAAQARVVDWSVDVEGSSLAMLRFDLDIRGREASPDEAALDAQLQAMVRGWGEAVEAELAARGDPLRAAAIAARYAEAFPLAYRTAYGPGEAAEDIDRLRRLAVGPEPSAPGRDTRLHQAEADTPGMLRLKLYQRQGELALSDAVPALENFGFRVIEDLPTTLEGEQLGVIHDFLLALPAGTVPEALLARAAEIEAALNAVLNGAAEDDAFNRLITVTGLAATETNWLRAWYRYLRQAGMSFGVPSAVDALQHAGPVTRGLIALFRARHDPSVKVDRTLAESQAGETIRDGLARVAAINDDRLLRAFRAVVEAMLRTNAYAVKDGAALAFKLDSALIPGLPRPVPWREIFVYSRQVEGIHLRAGPIARGGLRWSDRRDDFRTEVLGLMKAQRVKNAVIVPTGAKGGFYPKQLPDPATMRDAWLAEGKASYQTFVRALLSLTDNIVDGKVVHPAGVVVRDGDDPYFVVAADKGTATFSDTANALADEFDFWLDDAFASGGSKGYDHKAMGITARGAWLSVRRHFLELGVDVQIQSIRVAGCGDMSGDVFGNGMLLSQALKLVAAFDHRHIFIDPDPDPARSWAERQRLYALPRSSWGDYDAALLSKGGGVFLRSQKEIALSPEAQAVLGIAAATTDPDTLIAAILRSPVDLLWFGGIGTYVKAAAENNVQVGDPANDALRVDGAEIRARVIGEGANLGCTQAGRIEFALDGSEGRGGRINTDFIDNSAGVDCSDNEVNIKIALALARRSGRLSEASRISLLVEMTDDVAALVLEDNRLQALALSIAEAGGAAAAASHVRLIEMLEERGQLDRRTEGLADSEALTRRAADGDGLTRPELAVLLSSAKLALQDAVEQAPLAADPRLADELLEAFPPAMRKRFKRDILAHRLRGEIVATRIANRMVNRLGLIHPFELAEEEGASLAQVAGAFVDAEALFGMAAIWRAIEDAAMPEAARILLFERAAQGLRAQMGDLLRASAGTSQPGQLREQLAHGVAALSAKAESLLGPEARARSARLRGELAAAGAPAAESAMITHLQDLDGAIGLAALSGVGKRDPAAMTLAFGDLGARLGLDWAQHTAARMSPSDPWERLLVAGLARDFQQMQFGFLHRIAPHSGDPLPAVARWAAQREPAVRQFRAMVARARLAVSPSPAMLAEIANQARNLLAR